MVIKNVSRGEPITALWANSLVNEVNLNQGIRLRGRNVNESSGSRIQMASEPAFQIRFTKNGYVTLNAGQIYINGYLVTQTVEEGQNAKHSYNQFSSIKNWDKYAIHQMANGAEDLPEWYILITSPKNVTESNVNEVEAELVKNTKGQAKPTKPENIGNDKLWACVQISKVVDNQLLQLVSGSIFFSTPSESFSSYDGELSIIAGDGINVDFDANDNAYTISAKLSIIPVDNIITTNQYTDTDNTLIVELGANLPEIHKQVSIIAGDGIIVDSKEYTDVITYTISTTFSPINFDEEWFIIEEDGTITVNEEKLEAEATALAKSVSSEIQTTATMRLDYWTDESNNTNGAIHATINTEDGETASASFSAVRY